MYRVTSDSSSDQNPHGLHRTTCESSLPTTTRVKSPPSPLTSDGFVAKRLEKIAKEVESIIVSQHFYSFDQEVPTHKHQPHHFHEFMLLTRIVGARFDKSDRSCQHDEQATDSFM
ncbi:hypothetical protein Bca52824_048397 [Brassica carinata]|uniref:Uncharacterized protein n=1 Tax=Brassica carinata TaxID=52824 RepID=A0A8X7RIX0_BRACI|nr:hypothetical protein Bca52824_048397 [Brassica carinata]